MLAVGCWVLGVGCLDCFIDPLPPHLDPSDEAGLALQRQWQNRAYIVGALGLVVIVLVVSRIHFHHAKSKDTAIPAKATPAPMDEIAMEKTALDLQEKGD